MADQVEQIRALDWIATGEHKDRDLHGRYLINQMLSLICAEFHWVTLRLRRGAAMHARQIARLCHFPNGNEWVHVEIDRIDLRVHSLMRPRY
jgi:hypothetical protein